MALDQKFFKKSTTAATQLADQAEGLVLHLDANDVDSYDGDGSIWYDITKHEVNIPLADKASNLVLNLDGGTYTSGAWEDQSANTNNASLNGNATYNSDTRGYFTLDGTGDYLQIADHSSLNLGAATYEMWFRQPSYIATEHLFGRYESSNYDFFIRTSGTSGAIETTFYNGSSAIHSNIISANSAYTANEWSHVAVTLAGNTTGSAVKLYVNGTLQATQNLTGNRITDAAANLYLGILGSGYTAQYEFTGDIGTTRIYNVALTAAEVAQNFRAGNFLSYSSIITSKHEATQGSLITVPPTQSTLYTSNLAFHLDANGHSGTDWTDSANNINGTINGATYVDNDNSDYFDFDGSNDYISIGATGTLDTGNVKSFEFWFQAGNEEHAGHILTRSNTSFNQRAYAFRHNSDKFQVYFYNGSSVKFNGSSNGHFFSVTRGGGWIHAVVTIAGTTSGSAVKLYKNGIIAAEGTLSGDVGTNSSFITNIGRRSLGTSPDYFNGKIGQIRAYSVVLGADEVLQNYNATKDLYQGVTDLVASYDANGYSGSGNWLDTSGNGKHLTIISSPTYTNDGNSDYFLLDGTDDKFTNADIDLNSSDITMEFMVWINALGNYSNNVFAHVGGVGAVSNGVTTGFMLRELNGALSLRDMANDFSSATTALSPNKWHHLVCTVTGKIANLYVDGVNVLSNATLGGTYSPSATDRLIIGNYNNSSEGWIAGKLAQVRIYRGAMSAAQVNTNYNAIKTLYQNPDILTDLIPSNYSSGTTWNDSSTKSNNATLNNFGSTVADYYDEEIGNFFDLESNDYFETSITKNWASIPFSVEMWFNTDSRNGEYLWGFNDTVGNGVGASIRGSGNSYHLQFLGSGLIVSAGVVETNRWYHLVFTSDGTTKKAYLDGQLKGSGTTTINSAANGKAFIFGRYGTANSGYYNGKMGHVRLYEGALTAEQVAQNYLSTKNNYPNGNNATITGASWDTYNQGGVTYNYFTFDGADDKMEIVHSSDVQIDGPYTWMFWFRPHNTNSGNFLMSKIQASSYGQNILLQSSNVIRFTGYSSGGYGSRHETATSAFTDNAWQHLAITIEGNSSGDDIDFFINGSQVGHSTGTYSSATLTQDQASDTSNSNLFLGAYQFGANPNHFFDGDIGYFKCLKKQLSSAEILTEYNATKGTYGL